jgi:hypothetical protein
VTYQGEGFVKVLTADLSMEPLCVIVANGDFGGLVGTVTLTGVIEPDGVTCTFDGDVTTIMTQFGPIDAMITSGSATLSGGGEALSTSQLLGNLLPPPPDEPIPFDVDPIGPCVCVSVEPINQGARTEDAQRIHRKRWKSLESIWVIKNPIPSD